MNKRNTAKEKKKRNREFPYKKTLTTKKQALQSLSSPNIIKCLHYGELLSIEEIKNGFCVLCDPVELSDVEREISSQGTLNKELEVSEK